MSCGNILKNIWVVSFDEKGSLADQKDKILKEFFSRNRHSRPKKILIQDSSFGFRLCHELKRNGVPAFNEGVILLSTC
jgi:hypothetical protein